MLKYALLLSLLIALSSCRNRQSITLGSMEADTLECDSVTSEETRNFVKEEPDSIPQKLMDSLKDGFSSSRFTPNFVRSDFSGDGIIDYAVLTQHTLDEEFQITFFHSEGTRHKVGGGDGMETGNLTLAWITGIGLFEERKTYRTTIDEETGDVLVPETVLLERNALSLYSKEYGTVGLLYWDGGKYIYIHQLD